MTDESKTKVVISTIPRWSLVWYLTQMHSMVAWPIISAFALTLVMVKLRTLEHGCHVGKTWREYAEHTGNKCLRVSSCKPFPHPATPVPTACKPSWSGDALECSKASLGT